MSSTCCGVVQRDSAEDGPSCGKHCGEVTFSQCGMRGAFTHSFDLTFYPAVLYCFDSLRTVTFFLAGQQNELQHTKSHTNGRTCTLYIKKGFVGEALTLRKSINCPSPSRLLRMHCRRGIAWCVGISVKTGPTNSTCVLMQSSSLNNRGSECGGSPSPRR